MAWSALLSLLAFWASTQPTLLPLPASRCHFFAAFWYTSTEYLALDREGRYLRIDSEHMGVEVADTGAWRQRADGVVELTSERRVRDVTAAGLTVSCAADTPAEAELHLRALRAEVAGYLARHPAATVARRDIAAIGARGGDADGDPIASIEVDEWDPQERPLPRATLVALLAALDRELAASDRNVLRFTPLALGDDTFLEWHDSEIPADRDRWQEIELLGSARWEKYPAMMFTRVPWRVFAEGAGTTQAFTYFPEMNERRVPDQIPELRRLAALCVEPGE